MECVNSPKRQGRRRDEKQEGRILREPKRGDPNEKGDTTICRICLAPPNELPPQMKDSKNGKKLKKEKKKKKRKARCDNYLIVGIILVVVVQV